MLSQTVEYALRAVVILAHRSPAPLTTTQIAEATQVPQPYLAKVMQSLRKEGVVNSQRGVGGGITLAIPPDKLTLLQVINAVDPVQRIKECPLGIKTHGKNLCPLHKKLDASLAQIEEAFGSTTLATLLSDPSSVPLCQSQDGNEPTIVELS
ncbi:Rrf2 family transcriptional regulator [hydrothermal vent metagenome]|uniref:Rrf2 family transcriptional regulator n=1 Tax=hydrothermal vent metagenome TaxID=652676 RepID=A0A3B1DWE1_9ZZZZ